MDSKTINTNDMLMLLAERLGLLQLKLKNSITFDDEGKEHARLMAIAEDVKSKLDELVK